MALSFKNNVTPGVDAVEQDFIDALHRLKVGKPNNKALKQSVKLNTLKITITTVSLEAGHSRTLIGHKSCKYPSVRNQILALREDREVPTRLQEIISRKREETAELKRLLALAQSENAALRIRMATLEEKLKRKSREVQRLLKGNGVGDKKATGTVLTLSSKNDTDV